MRRIIIFFIETVLLVLIFFVEKVDVEMAEKIQSNQMINSLLNFVAFFITYKCVNIYIIER